MSAPTTKPEHGHAANWRQWLGHLAGQPNIRGCEIGVFRGESAEWMLENIFTHEDARYIGIDPFTGNAEHERDGVDMIEVKAEAYLLLRRFRQFDIGQIDAATFFKSVWPSDGARPFDFIYIDGAHDTMNVLRDSVLAWECLKVGGILIFDDYEWHHFGARPEWPRDAIDAFLLCYQRQLEVIAKGWQVCVRKVA